MIYIVYVFKGRDKYVGSDRHQHHVSINIQLYRSKPLLAKGLFISPLALPRLLLPHSSYPRTGNNLRAPQKKNW